jgi:DNA-binding response OmpR family regulator
MEEVVSSATAGPGPIVLVEDDYLIREAVETSLADEGYQVISFADGQEALTHLRSSSPPPPLVLLDLILPGLDGWGVRQAMLQDPRLKGLPCVVLTAAGPRAFAIYADLVLFKPVDLGRLLAVVGRFAPRAPALKQTGEFSPSSAPTAPGGQQAAPPEAPPARRGSGTGT